MVAIRQDADMDIPPPPVLLDKLSRLGPGRPLIERLRDQANVYVIGGAVRDLLLGQAPTDLDLAVEGDGEALVADLGGRVVRHERFGTWTVTVDGFSYDIARTRQETYARPGALPDVAPATLAEDLMRRDFTVNALAIALGGPEAGTLTTAPGAIDDLDHRWLRVLHDASFQDDPTRLLRLARYMSRLGFALEPHTAKLVAGAVADRVLDTVSGPRIGAELRLLAGEPDPLDALLTLNELNLAAAIHPGFGVAAEDMEVARRALPLLPSEVPRDRLVVALAARRVRASELGELLDRLAFEAEGRNAIVTTATRGEQVARLLAGTRRASEVARSAAGLPPELVALAGALGPEEVARSWLEQLRHVRLEITGTDLLDSGIDQGPAVGRGLQAALAAKLDRKIQGRDAELAVALEAARATG
jgi:tRNA nucleotidyltransferase (CCA-adding enzyme)